MQVTHEKIASGFFVVPNLEEFFGEFRNQENCLDIIGSFEFDNVARIYLARVGALAITFLDEGHLRSIPKYRTRGSGAVPDYAMENHDRIVELQERRMLFANFIAAALFGHLSAIRRSALSGAQYVGMDEIVGFGRSGTTLVLESSAYTDDALAPKVRLAQRNPREVRIATPTQIQEMIAFVAHLAERKAQFEYADTASCMVMNYQAAILHSEQHSAASLALNFVVAEALVNELFAAYGLVRDRPPKSFANRSHTVTRYSNGRFRELSFASKILALRDGGLIDWYLHQRLDEARRQRNDLMHGADRISVSQSGTLQTAVRDLWAYLLDRPFELCAGWSMRM